LTRCHTGSQWSCRSIGVMWSCRRALVIIRAAGRLWVQWSYSELQKVFF